MPVNRFTSRFLFRAFDVFCFVYVAAIFYRNVKINGVEYGVYLRPIAAIPAFLLFAVAMVVEYVKQHHENNKKVSLQDVKKFLIKRFSDFIDEFLRDPLRVIRFYFWDSFKNAGKRFLFFFFLMLPLGVIFSIFQALLTGGGRFFVEF